LGAVDVFFTLFAMLVTFCNKMVVLTESVYSLVMVGMAMAGVALCDDSNEYKLPTN
jgi:hypothetical protein